jgi:hypothetical protein
MHPTNQDLLSQSPFFTASAIKENGKLSNVGGRGNHVVAQRGREREVIYELRNCLSLAYGLGVRNKPAEFVATSLANQLTSTGSACRLSKSTDSHRSDFQFNL